MFSYVFVSLNQEKCKRNVTQMFSAFQQSLSWTYTKTFKHVKANVREVLQFTTLPSLYKILDLFLSEDACFNIGHNKLIGGNLYDTSLHTQRKDNLISGFIQLYRDHKGTERKKNERLFSVFSVCGISECQGDSNM